MVGCGIGVGLQLWTDVLDWIDGCTKDGIGYGNGIGHELMLARAMSLSIHL